MNIPASCSLCLCPFCSPLPLCLSNLCILTLSSSHLCPTFLSPHSLQSLVLLLLLLLSNITQSPPIPIQHTLTPSLPLPLSLPPSLFLPFISPPASRSTLLLFAHPACSRPLSLSLSLNLSLSLLSLVFFSVFLSLSVSFSLSVLHFSSAARSSRARRSSFNH